MNEIYFLGSNDIKIWVLGRFDIFKINCVGLFMELENEEVIVEEKCFEIVEKMKEVRILVDQNKMDEVNDIFVDVECFFDDVLNDNFYLMIKIMKFDV